MFVKFMYDAYVEGREDGEYVSDIAVGLLELIKKQDGNIKNAMSAGPMTITKTQKGRDLDEEIKGSDMKVKYIPYFDGTIGY